jgi:hypothetical protein
LRRSDVVFLGLVVVAFTTGALLMTGPHGRRDLGEALLFAIMLIGVFWVLLALRRHDCKVDGAYTDLGQIQRRQRDTLGLHRDQTDVMRQMQWTWRQTNDARPEHQPSGPQPPWTTLS